MVMVASHLDSGPLVLIPCRKTTFAVHANVGYDVGALGKTTEGSKELTISPKRKSFNKPRRTLVAANKRRLDGSIL